jgi:hypothetical protein
MGNVPQWMLDKLQQVNTRIPLRGKLNYVIDYFHDPCPTDPIIYVKTAIPVAYRIVVGLVTFGMDDLFRAYFRPKNLRGGCGGRRGRNPPHKTGIPQTEELFAHELPGGGGKFYDPFVDDGTRFLWKIDNVTQHGLYYVFIAELAEQGYYNWVTLIQAQQQGTYCGRGAGLKDGPALVSTGYDEWRWIEPTITEFARAPCYNQFPGFDCEGHKWFVGASMKGKNENANAIYNQFRIIANNHVVAQTDRQLYDSGQSVDIALWGEVPFGASVQIEEHPEPGPAFTQKAVLWVVQIDEQ